MCAAAAWSDEAVSVRERDVLARLAGALASSEEEKQELRDAVLADVNRHAALAAVAELRPDEKAHLFDTCLDLLLADQRLGRAEVAFLGKLRRPCGVSWWGLQRRLLALAVRHQPPVRSPLLQAAFLVFLSAVGVLWLRDTVGTPTGAREAKEHPPLSLAARPETAPELAGEALFEQVRRSVVSVNVLVEREQRCVGSGAVIGLDARGRSYVLTNRHVVDCGEPPAGEATFEVVHDSGARFDAWLDHRSSRHDLALLAVAGLGEFSRPVPMRPRAELRVGEPVYALGSPLGLRGSFTSGIVSALREDWLQTDAGLAPGSSGGPLFDRQGLLCGVVTRASPSRAIGLAIYTDTVLEMLEARVAPAPASPAAP